MKVVTFGEIMLRLAPKGYNRFFQDDILGATFGGGEANVAVSLANYGVDSYFVTKLPNHDIGEAAIRELNYYGVNTSNVARGGERVGIYFLEKGASQRPSKVIYDRKYSSISQAQFDDFNWISIFKDTDWFHFTGITPALSDDLALITLDALRIAKRMGVKVSCDLNYRTKLWSTKRANEVMTEFMQYVDVLIANEEDAENVFGIKSDLTNVSSGELNREGYVDVAKQLKEKFKFEKVAITLRESLNANENNWSALLYDEQAFFSPVYNLNIVDRVGGGDSFCGGLIYALLQDFESEDAVNFAVAASALKHSVEGDFNRVSVVEVENLMNGDTTGRVQR
ncbi:MAG: sugar kinase [Bacteroidales bacterium]|nr:sugar kinase [Bacteroidales bacterium]